MPFLAPILDLLIGLVLRLIVWSVVALAKMAARFVWSAITDHPGLAFLGVLVAQREGWITSPYTPFVLAALGVLAIVRFFTSHPPADVAKRVQREARKAYETGAAISGTGRKARAWIGRRFRRKSDATEDLPPPPRPVADEAIPMGPIAENGDALEHHDQAGVVAEAFAGGDSLVTSNGRKP